MIWRIVTGLNYRPKGSKTEVRAEPGQVVDDLPAKAVKWLQRDGAIEPVDEED